MTVGRPPLRMFGECFYCGNEARLSPEHVKPWSRGGTDAITNLVGACRPCNSSKGAKTPAEWIGRLYLRSLKDGESHRAAQAALIRDRLVACGFLTWEQVIDATISVFKETLEREALKVYVMAHGMCSSLWGEVLPPEDEVRRPLVQASLPYAIHEALLGALRPPVESDEDAEVSA